MSDTLKEECEEFSKDLLIQTLYAALHDIAPHYDSLVSRFVEDKRKPAYQILYTNALNAMNSYAQYEEVKDGQF